jgi:hypothetical protein
MLWMQPDSLCYGSNDQHNDTGDEGDERCGLKDE